MSPRWEPFKRQTQIMQWISLLTCTC